MNTEYSSKKLFKRHNVEQEVMGDEPDWPEDIVDTNDIRLARIYSWFNYFHDKEDGKKWIIKWMKSAKYPEKEINSFERSPFVDCSLRYPIIARMLNRGFNVSNGLVDKLKFFIWNCQMITKRSDTEVQKPQAKTITVQDRIQDKIKEAIGELEAEIDIFIRNNYKESHNNTPIYERLKALDIKGSQAKQIKDYYLPLKEEIEQIDKDPQLKEAYKDLSKEQKKNYLKYMNNLISDIDRHIVNESVVKIRKPRASKPIDQTKLIKNVKYKIEDKDLKLVSVKPSSIIGSTQVWLYNTKYKMLRKLETSDPKGLSIKGTTIEGFDEKLSRAKSLRKPQIVLAEVLSSTKHSLKKIFDNLTTVDSPINGRVNEDTIILRTIK